MFLSIWSPRTVFIRFTGRPSHSSKTSHQEKRHPKETSHQETVIQERPVAQSPHMTGLHLATGLAWWLFSTVQYWLTFKDPCTEYSAWEVASADYMHKTPHVSTPRIAQHGWSLRPEPAAIPFSVRTFRASFTEQPYSLPLSNVDQVQAWDNNFFSHTPCSFHPRTSELSFNPLREAACGISRPAHVLRSYRSRLLHWRLECLFPMGAFSWWSSGSTIPSGRPSYISSTEPRLPSSKCIHRLLPTTRTRNWGHLAMRVFLRKSDAARLAQCVLDA
jgi:hypothetical protein